MLTYSMSNERPRSFCQKCRWQVTPEHTYTLNQTKLEWADCAVRAVWESTRENELTHNSSGNTWPQLSQLTEPLWTDPGLKKVELVCMSQSPLKNIKNAQMGNESSVLPPNPHKQGKSHPPLTFVWDTPQQQIFDAASMCFGHTTVICLMQPFCGTYHIHVSCSLHVGHATTVLLDATSVYKLGHTTSIYV